MINPYAVLAAVLLLVGSSAASFLYGKSVGRDGLVADQAADVAAQRERDAERQVNVEAIGTAAAAAVAAALNKTAGDANASVERIRTVVVPAECRAVDPASLQELRMGADAANTALRDGLRQLAASPTAGHSGDAP